MAFFSNINIYFTIKLDIDRIYDTSHYYSLIEMTNIHDGKKYVDICIIDMSNVILLDIPAKQSQSAIDVYFDLTTF